jgi:hypothetical protein
MNMGEEKAYCIAFAWTHFIFELTTAASWRMV